jgi:ABC-type glycerol-3-phosphate transport system substrate-binding protein
VVRYHEFPAEEMEKSNPCPDIIAGGRMKNVSIVTDFRALDNVFGAKKLSRNIFYPRLLAVGRIDRYQYLLPVSFNIPALVFLKDRENELSNSFTINFEEIKTLSKSFNIETRGTYTRMGFSPLWNDDFLLVAATLFDASFREDMPLAWDQRALDRSMNFIYNWTHEINTNNQMEGDFTFKYFFEPPEKLIQSGRILFSYMASNSFFTLNEDIKNNLDFRWLMEDNRIPITEGTVYMGIPKKSKSQKAAMAFMQWFFRIESQRQILEYCRSKRINESVFGICGGFSALNSVTEQIFPQFYPDLLGSIPPSENLVPHNNLPPNWAVIKERVVLPYLHDRARSAGPDEVTPLEKRLNDWIRVNH